MTEGRGLCQDSMEMSVQGREGQLSEFVGCAGISPSEQWLDEVDDVTPGWAHDSAAAALQTRCLYIAAI